MGYQGGCGGARVPLFAALAAVVGVLVGLVGLAIVTASPTAALQQLCDGRPVTIVGSAGGETINGTEGNDVILALGGDDTIDGRGGDDVICGGDGDDTITGGEGRDRIFGDAGLDALFGGDGIDYVWGGAGADVLEGEGGSDRLRGGSGEDEIRGGSGADRIWGDGSDDVIFGQGGQDQIWGGWGDDLIQGNWQSDMIRGGDGNDTIGGAEGRDVLYGDDGIDTLTGGKNSDTLSGGRGVDLLSGGPGLDALSGGLGADVLSGGPHEDTCDRGAYDSLLSCQIRTWGIDDRWTLVEARTSAGVTEIESLRAMLELESTTGLGFLSAGCAGSRFGVTVNGQRFDAEVPIAGQSLCAGNDRALLSLLVDGVDQADEIGHGASELTLRGPSITLRFQRVGWYPLGEPLVDPGAILAGVRLTDATSGNGARSMVDRGSVELGAPLPKVSAFRQTFAKQGTPTVVGGTEYSVDWQIFSLTTGALFESTFDSAGSRPVHAVGDGSQPQALEAAMLARPVESDYLIIFPAGMEDMPANLPAGDAYLVYAQTYQSVETQIAELESEWASARQNIVNTITRNDWGRTGNVVRGPGDMTIDLSACPADWSDTAGIADGTVKIGHTTSMSGVLAAYGNIGVGMGVYFDHVNDNGGIGPDGLQLELLMRDDAYVPTATQNLVNELLANDDAFSITTLGSPPTFAVQGPLNDACVPHPLSMSGHQAWGDPVNHPWTTGLQMSYATEALLWGTWIEQNLEAPVTVGAVVMDNDFGLTYEQAFADFAEASDVITSVRFVRHDPAAWTLAPEIATLAAEAPDVYISMTAGNPCLLAIQEAHRVGITSSADAFFTPSVCKGAAAYMAPAGAAADNWLIMGGGWKDSAERPNGSDPFISWMNDEIASVGLDPSISLYATGFGQFGWTYVQALQIAAELDGGLSRTNFMVALRALRMNHPGLVDGITLGQNGARDAYLVEGSDVSRFDYGAQAWRIESVLDIDGQTPNCSWVAGRGCNSF